MELDILYIYAAKSILSCHRQLILNSVKNIPFKYWLKFSPLGVWTSISAIIEVGHKFDNIIYYLISNWYNTNNNIYQVDWIQPELLDFNPSWISNNQRAIAINFYWDFVAGTNSDIFEGQMDMGIIYRPDLSKEAWLSNLEEED
jgi:hypothetical protein